VRTAFLVAFLCCAAAARAQNAASDPEAPWITNIGMPRSMAMGGAHSAIATSNDAILVNPAGMSQGPRYHVELDGALDRSFPAQGVIASVVDTKSAPVASGLLFARWGAGQPGGRAEGWQAQLAYSYPVSGFFVGGASKYLHYHTQEGLVSKFTQDIGLLAKRGSLSYALVVQNISLSNTPLSPLTTTAGIAWGTDFDWHIALDYKTDFSDTSNIKSKLAGGVEYLLEQSLAVRLGGTWDITHKVGYISAGVGIQAEVGGIQVAWRRRLSGPFDQVLEAGITVYME
jgi:hypothetical protein